MFDDVVECGWDILNGQHRPDAGHRVSVFVHGPMDRLAESVRACDEALAASVRYPARATSMRIETNRVINSVLCALNCAIESRHISGPSYDRAVKVRDALRRDKERLDEAWNKLLSGQDSR